jgi:hypothetical protein
MKKIMLGLAQVECESLWKQLSPDGAPISEATAGTYVSDFKAANPDGDTTLEQDEFSKACDSGLVKSSAASGAGAGESGAADPGAAAPDAAAPAPAPAPSPAPAP